MDASNDPVKRDARRWVTRLASGEATTADARSLRMWRRQSPAHEAAYVEAIRFWKQLGPGSRAFVAKRGVPVWSGARERLSRRAMLSGAGALAAAAASYAVIAPPLDLWPSLEELRADNRTATGEQRQLAVGDVVVQMNTQTSIAVASPAGDTDRVRLVTGEAAFAMPSRSERPLVVLAGRGQVTAVRARFDVRNIASSVCVTCLEGELRVYLDGQNETIGAGRQYNYGERGSGQAVNVDPAAVTSWQDGFIVFRATPLSAAVAEINRYRPGKVFLINHSLASKAVSGRFRIERIDEVLGWIERATGASSRSLPGGVVLLS